MLFQISKLDFNETLVWNPHSMWQMKLNSEPHQSLAIISKYSGLLPLLRYWKAYVKSTAVLILFFTKFLVILGKNICKMSKMKL